MKSETINQIEPQSADPSRTVHIARGCQDLPIDSHLKKGVLEPVILIRRRIVDPHHAPGLGQQRGLLPLAAGAAARAAPHLDGLVVLPVDLDAVLPDGKI